MSDEEIRLAKEFDELEKERTPREFPADSNVYHFHPIAFVEQMKLLITKEDIDLRPLMTFEPQRGSSDCNITCKRIMKKMGVIAEGATGEISIFGGSYRQSKYQLANETASRDSLIFYEEPSIKGVAYLDRALEYGHPVLVGVHHTFQYRGGKGINEGTTDHYVIIVGRKYVGGKQFYIFWDVGTRRGNSTEWVFEYREGKLIADKTYKSGNKSYTLIQIRRNIDENGKTLTY